MAMLGFSAPQTIGFTVGQVWLFTDPIYSNIVGQTQTLHQQIDVTYGVNAVCMYFSQEPKYFIFPLLLRFLKLPMGQIEQHTNGSIYPCRRH